MGPGRREAGSLDPAVEELVLLADLLRAAEMTAVRIVLAVAQDGLLGVCEEA